MNIHGKCNKCEIILEMDKEGALMLIEGEEVGCAERYDAASSCEGTLFLCTEEGVQLNHVKDMPMKWIAGNVMDAYIIKLLMEKFMLDTRLLHGSDLAGSVVVIRSVEQQECEVMVNAEVFVEGC